LLLFGFCFGLWFGTKFPPPFQRGSGFFEVGDAGPPLLYSTGGTTAGAEFNVA